MSSKLRAARVPVLVIAMILCVIMTSSLFARPNTLVRDSIPEQYKWDLSHIYPDWEAWDADIVKLQDYMNRYVELRGTLANGPEVILRAQLLSDSLGMTAYKAYRYPALSSVTDTRDNEMSAKLQQVGLMFSQFGIATAWYTPELLEIPEETMQTWLNETPELEPYRLGIEDAYRQKDHVLSEDKEQLLAYFSQVNGAPGSIYSQLTTSDIEFPTVTLSDGEETVMTPGNYYNTLSNNMNQADRATAFEAFYGTFFANKNTYAAIYNGILQADWASCQARDYPSCLEATLFGDNVPLTVYETLVKTAQEGVGPMLRYNELRKKMLGLEEYHLYDGSVPLIDFHKEYDFEEIQDWIVASVAPLGKDYQEQLKAAFTNRWIDVYENEGKRSGAFNAGVYGVHPYLLLNYNETMRDMFTTAHELGHCMHSILSAENQPFTNHSPSIFVAEVASTMNEALLLDFLLERTEDPMERIALLDQAIDAITGTFYTQTMWADFEWKAHQMVEQNQPVTAESIMQLYSNIVAPYNGDVVTYDEFYRYTWTRISHFYNSPFYVYKYATCYASSAKLFDEIMSDDKALAADAMDRYMTLLKSGSNDYPMLQLQKAGVDLTDPATVQAVVDKLDRYVTQLEEELNKI